MCRSGNITIFSSRLANKPWAIRVAKKIFDGQGGAPALEIVYPEGIVFQVAIDRQSGPSSDIRSSFQSYM